MGKPRTLFYFQRPLQMIELPTPLQITAEDRIDGEITPLPAHDTEAVRALTEIQPHRFAYKSQPGIKVQAEG